MRAYAPGKHVLASAVARATRREPQLFHESVHPHMWLLSHPTPLNPAAPRANMRRTPGLPLHLNEWIVVLTTSPLLLYRRGCLRAVRQWGSQQKRVRREGGR